MHARSTRLSQQPLAPQRAAKSSYPKLPSSHLTRSWRNGQKEEEGGCQLKPADLPMHRGAVPRVVFSPPRGISLLATHTPPIPKRNPNRIFSPHAAHLFFCCLGPAAGLTYARRRGGGGRGVAGPGARLNLRLKRVPTTSTTYTQAKQRTTPSQPLPTTHQSPGSHKHGVANRGQLIRWPQYIYSRG